MEKTSGFKDKVALVVGGTSGMGNAVVRLSARAGCRTHIFHVRETAGGWFQSCNVRD